MSQSSGSQQDRELEPGVETTVRDFYNTFGWVAEDGLSGEDLLFRRFRKAHRAYQDEVTRRTVSCFPDAGNSLLVAGCGDLPDSHVAVVDQFAEVCCLDISEKALEVAESKLGDRATYRVGSILDIPFTESSFDAVYCAHVIYHIDRDLQESAINELIRVTKAGGRIVVIYSNPDSHIERIAVFRGRIGRLFRALSRHPRPEARKPGPSTAPPPLYWYRHPLRWWDRFDPLCSVRLLPWIAMSDRQERILIRSDRSAAIAYRLCSLIERKLPELATKWWQYQIITLDKASDERSVRRNAASPQPS